MGAITLSKQLLDQTVPQLMALAVRHYCLSSQLYRFVCELHFKCWLCQIFSLEEDELDICRAGTIYC